MIDRCSSQWPGGRDGHHSGSTKPSTRRHTITSSWARCTHGRLLRRRRRPHASPALPWIPDYDTILIGLPSEVPAFPQLSLLLTLIVGEPCEVLRRRRRPLLASVSRRLVVLVVRPHRLAGLALPAPHVARSSGTGSRITQQGKGSLTTNHRRSRKISPG